MDFTGLCSPGGPFHHLPCPPLHLVGRQSTESYPRWTEDRPARPRASGRQQWSLLDSISRTFTLTLGILWHSGGTKHAVTSQYSWLGVWGCEGWWLDNNLFRWTKIVLHAPKNRCGNQNLPSESRRARRGAGRGPFVHQLCQPFKYFSSTSRESEFHFVTDVRVAAVKLWILSCRETSENQLLSAVDCLLGFHMMWTCHSLIFQEM